MLAHGRVRAWMDEVDPADLGCPPLSAPTGADRTVSTGRPRPEPRPVSLGGRRARPPPRRRTGSVRRWAPPGPTTEPRPASVYGRAASRRARHGGVVIPGPRSSGAGVLGFGPTGAACGAPTPTDADNASANRDRGRPPRSSDVPGPSLCRPILVIGGGGGRPASLVAAPAVPPDRWLVVGRVGRINPNGGGRRGSRPIVSRPGPMPTGRAATVLGPSARWSWRRCGLRQ